MSQNVDIRQRILASAWELFYTRNFSDVGVQAICQHAGVNKGSFYHFFRSKQELVLAVLDSFADEFERDLFNRALNSDRTPWERLERLLDMVYRFQQTAAETMGQTPGCMFGNLSAELSSSNPGFRERIQRIFVQMQARLAETLEQYQVDAGLPPLDAAATAEAMIAYLQGLQLMARTYNDPELIRRLGPAMLQLQVARGNSS